MRHTVLQKCQGCDCMWWEYTMPSPGALRAGNNPPDTLHHGNPGPRTITGSTTLHMDISAIMDQIQALGVAGKCFVAYFRDLPANAYPGQTPAITVLGTTPQLQPSRIADTPSTQRPQLCPGLTQFLSKRTKRHIWSCMSDVVLGTNEQGTVALSKEESRHWNQRMGCGQCPCFGSPAADGWNGSCWHQLLSSIHHTDFWFCDQYKWDPILQFDFLYRKYQRQHHLKFSYIPANMELSLLSHAQRRGLPSHH